MKVQYDCQLEIALAGPDVTDVGAPFLIWSSADKVLIKQIDCNRTVVVAVRRILETASLVGPQSVFAHQTGDAVTTNRQSFLTQLGMHAQATITNPERTPQ